MTLLTATNLALNTTLLASAASSTYLDHALIPSDLAAAPDAHASQASAVSTASHSSGSFFPTLWNTEPRQLGVFSRAANDIPTLQEALDWAHENPSLSLYISELMENVDDVVSDPEFTQKGRTAALKELVRDHLFDLPREATDHEDATDNLLKLGALEVFAREYRVFGAWLEVWVEGKACRSEKRKIRISGLINELAYRHHRALNTPSAGLGRFDKEDDPGSRLEGDFR